MSEDGTPYEEIVRKIDANTQIPGWDDLIGGTTHTIREASEPETFTLTHRVRKAWWKRPILWLLRKPTSDVVDVYENVRITSMHMRKDGAMCVDMTSVVAPDVQRIDMSSELRTPDE